MLHLGGNLETPQPGHQRGEAMRLWCQYPVSPLRDITWALLPLEKSQLVPVSPWGAGKLPTELSGEKLQGERKSVAKLPLGQAVEMPGPVVGRGAEARHGFPAEHLAQLPAAIIKFQTVTK